MKADKDSKKLDELISKAVGRQVPAFDFGKWKDNHRAEAEVFKSQTTGKKKSAVRLFEIGRTIMNSPITKIAAAAVIIITIMLIVSHLGAPIVGSNIAFGDVRKAVERMPVMHRVYSTDYGKGRKHLSEVWYDFTSRSVISRYSRDGNVFKISSLNYETMKNVVYDPNSNVVTIRYRRDVSSDPEYPPTSPLSVIENYLKDFEQQDALVEHEKVRHEARDVDIYRFSIPRNFRGEKVLGALTVDRDTHLPMTYERRWWTQEGDLTLDQTMNFDFPEEGPRDIYDVGVPRETRVVYDSDSKMLLERKNKLLADKSTYERQFSDSSSAYSLEEGQILKLIPPALVEPRAGIDRVNEMLRQLRNVSRHEEISTATVPHTADRYTMFRWEGEEVSSTVGSRPLFKGGLRLVDAFRRMIGLSKFEYEVPDELDNLVIQGDWIARTGTSKRQLMKAFEKIVQDYSKRHIRFEERQIGRHVIVAGGTFRFSPLPETYDNSAVHVFSDKTDPDERGGGGSGSLDKFLRYLGDIPLNELVINETKDSRDIRVRYRWHYSGYVKKIENDIERAEKLQTLLDNLSSQTGLEFKQERRKVSIWIVAEKNK